MGRIGGPEERDRGSTGGGRKMAHPGIVPHKDGAASQDRGKLGKWKLARNLTGPTPRKLGDDVLVRLTLNPYDIEPRRTRQPSQPRKALRSPILARSSARRVYRYKLRWKPADPFVDADTRKRGRPGDPQRLERLHQVVASMNPVGRQWSRLDELHPEPLQFRRQKRQPRPSHHPIESRQKIEKLRLLGTLLKKRTEPRAIDRVHPSRKSATKRKLNVRRRPHHLDPRSDATQGSDSRKRNDGVA